jgi:hypothetical protein
LTELRLEKHPDKTFIGKACRGFDFLGYHFLPGRISVSWLAQRRLAERPARLYKQGGDSIRVERYVRRQWGRTSLAHSAKGMTVDCPSLLYIRLKPLSPPAAALPSR